MVASKTPLRILQVTAALDEGGVERGTLEMAAYTVAQGVESHVASNGGKLVKELEAIGARHYQLPLASRAPWSILYCAWQLIRIIRKHQIDLVHARSRAPAWAAFIACRRTKTKFITTFHGAHKIQNRVKWLYNSVMTRGERVIAISAFMRQHIMDNYFVAAAQIDVAPRGFDPHIFNPGLFSAQTRAELRASLGIGADCPIISLPGRLTRLKGQTVFLKALAQIQDLSWQALIIGGASKKAPYEQELKSLAAELGLAPRVKFLGSQPDIARFYAVSDIVVSASTEPEAFGRVAVEAQAMAKPIVASALGGSLETVKDAVTGRLYDVQDKHGLADALRRLLANPELLPVMGQAGRAWVLDRFTTEKTCAAEWQAYMRTLEKTEKSASKCA